MGHPVLSLRLWSCPCGKPRVKSAAIPCHVLGICKTNPWSCPGRVTSGDRSCEGDFTQSDYWGCYVVKLQFELEILQHLLTNIDLEFIWLSAMC